MLNDKDSEILKAFFAAPKGENRTQLAERLGITRSAVRDALCRAKRAGIDIDRRHTKPEQPEPEPQRDDVVTVTVARLAVGKMKPECLRTNVTLPRLSFVTAQDDEEPIRRIVTPPPKVSQADIIRQQRVAMIREIHQAGLRRGLFRIGSR